MPSIIGVIPARYASTRFPGKPLIQIAGKSMIQRVYEQCLQAKSLNDIIVATDDERIADHVKSFKGNVVFTSTEHQSGTDRCAEAISKFSGNAHAVINIQGDEPFIDPKQIDLLAQAFLSPETQIATLIKPFQTGEDINNPNEVKVIKNNNQQAIYFSRLPIPYRRNPEAQITYYKHVGIYGYTTAILKQITQLPIGNLEKAESLEQLRWIESGFIISLLETDIATIAIDTPEDLARVEKMMKS